MRRRNVKTASLCLAAAMAFGAAASSATAATKGPGDWIKPGVPLSGQQHPDPSVVTFGDMAISSGTQHGGADLPVIWSTNLKTWNARNILRGHETRDGDTAGYFNDAIDNPSWGPYRSCTETASNRSGCDPKDLWAPGMDFVGDNWVSYSSVKISDSATYSSYGRFAIYRASAASPFGHYTPVSNNSIVTTSTTLNPAGVIDPEVFVDPSTNAPYLLYKTEGNKKGNYPTLYSRKLNATGTGFAAGSAAVKLLTVTPRTFEGTVIENPSMIKVNGKYILFYSANQYSSKSYSTAYAICHNGPSKPCSKPRSGQLLTSTAGRYGPGGADAFIDDRGRAVLMYAAFPKVDSRGFGTGGRTPRVAEFSVSSTGAVRILGTPTQSAGGGATWYGTESDATTFTSVARKVTSSIYDPFVADVNGDSFADIGLYGSWTDGDNVLLGNGARSPLGTGGADAIGQAGSFTPVSGDFNGDGRGDVYWYEPGADSPFMDDRSSRFEPAARPDQLWLSKPGGGWDKIVTAQNSVTIPYAADSDGDGTDELHWYSPGKAADQTWVWNPGARDFSKSSTTMPDVGTRSPEIGDLDGDGLDDAVWYTPGASQMTIWWGATGASSSKISVGPTTQKELRQPVVGDFDGDDTAEIYWYGPRSVRDDVWDFSSRTAHTSAPGRAINGSYEALVGDFDDDGVDDIHWFG